MKDEWRPIEIAPKDKVVLVAPGLYYDKTCSIARYDDDRYNKKPRPYRRRDDAYGVLASRGTPPTHWMPLPDAPAKNNEQKVSER